MFLYAERRDLLENRFSLLLQLRESLPVVLRVILD